MSMTYPYPFLNGYDTTMRSQGAYIDPMKGVVRGLNSASNFPAYNLPRAASEALSKGTLRGVQSGMAGAFWGSDIMSIYSFGQINNDLKDIYDSLYKPVPAPKRQR